MKPPKAPRILTIDIESSPIEAFVWGLFDQNVGLDFVKTDWSILSFAAKWFGEKRVIYSDTGGRGADKVRDDVPLLGQLWELLNEADFVVAQNGRRFDVRKINARLIQHGYTPYSPIRVIDTLLEARKHFAFTSQKLAWTSKLLTDAPKSEHKQFPGFELWVECLKDNPKAWKVMRRYNVQDVRSTEKVYLKLRPWIKNHPNISTFDLTPGGCCPNCGSADVKQIGNATLQAGIYPQYQCNSCGAWSRGKQLLNPTEVRKSKLT
ncbi:MAG: ribonuclease H-like domain-containing protein [Steroidobacteraceae bacterium]